MEIAVFKHYKNGYFTFEFDKGEDMVFEEVHPKVLVKYDLKNDKTYRGKSFYLSFSEEFEDDDEDLVIYRVENLKLIEN